MSRSKVINRCKMCHKMKSLSDYYVDKNQGDKHNAICKRCIDEMKGN